MNLLKMSSQRRFFRSVIIYFLAYCMFFNVSMPIALAGPEGAQVVNGDVSFQQSGYNTTITASDKAIINYSSFDISRPEIVQFIQPGTSASVLNRILSANPTNINGTLLANGRVFFVNPAGVYFGNEAQVNVNQLVASALDITDNDFINGRYRFTGGQGSVINQGDITAEKVYLIGRQVANSGSISCPVGYVVMASGDRVFLGEPGSDVVLEVDGPSLPETADPIEGAGVLNEGTVEAAGGTIVLAAAGDIYSQAISNVGSLSVSNYAGNAGEIKITADGEQITNSGTIDASGDNGGSVTIDGGNVTLTADSVIHADGTNKGGMVEILADTLVADGVITASGPQGAYGYILLDPTDLTIYDILAGNIVTALLGADYHIVASETINVEAEIDSSAQSSATTLFFDDEDTNNDLTINLNDKIILGSNQTLTGDGTEINVASTGLIQNGIDVATTGATVTVSNGAYTEDLAIDKSLSLEGAQAGVAVSGRTAGDAGESAITGEHTITGSTVTIDGFTLSDPDSGSGNVLVSLDSSGGTIDDVTLKNNFVELGSGDIGIDLGGYSTTNNAITNVAVEDSQFIGPDDKISNPMRIGGWFGSDYDVEVDGVTFQRNTVDKGSIPIQLQDEGLANINITQNTFTNTDGTVYIWGNSGSTPLGVLSDFEYSNNIIDNTNSYGVGIDVFDVFDNGNFGGTIRVTENSFDVSGLDLGSVGWFRAVSILSTGITDATIIDASGNWYGTNTAAGVAAEVSANVDYTPWLDVGTDQSADPGFQGDFSTLNVSAASPQAGPTERIQEAIDISTTGATITVSDGTYTEDLTVDKSNLTLKSVNGRDDTVIQLVDGVGIDIGSGGDGFILGGAASEGFEITSGGATTFDIQLTNGPSDVEISWNTIDTTGNASMGINIGAGGATDLTINQNNFIAEEGDGSIWGEVFGYDTTVSNNTFTGPGGLVGGYAIQFKAATGASTITGNNITGYGWGVGVLTGGGGTSGLTISDNFISNCKTGIGLAQYQVGDITIVDITGNTLSNNTTGLKIYDGANVKAGNFTIQNNSFSGNTTGLDNQHTSESVKAEENYWGDVDGPGSGDPITETVADSVDYSPWWGGDYIDDAHATSWIWGTDDSIQEAINLASTTVSDSIYITSGVYTEAVNVNKQLEGLYFRGDGTVASEIDGTLTLSDAVASNTGVDISTQNDGDLTLNTVSDTGVHSLGVSTGDGELSLDENVTANGGVTLDGGIINVGNDAGDKVTSSGAVSITGSGTVTIEAEIDPATVTITSEADASVNINNSVTADTQITVTADDDVTFSASGGLGTTSGSITVTADADGDDNGAGGAITMADGTVIDAGSGTITLSADENIEIGRLVTTNNTAAAVSITSTNGAVTDAGDTGGADIEAADASAVVTISAVTGIGTGGAIDTAASKIVASTTGNAAHIDIDNTSSSATELTSVSTTGTGANITFDQTGGGDLTLTNVTTTDGTIDISADSGNIIATLVTAGTGGDILLGTTTSGDITLGSLTAAGDMITINSAGSIDDASVDAVADLTADELDLDATDGIGAGSEIETVATTIDADTTGNAAHIDIDNTSSSATELTGVSTTGTGANVTFDQTGGGDLTLTSVTTADGTIDISADSGNITATLVTAGTSGDILLDTTISGDITLGSLTAAGDKITINSAGSIDDAAVDAVADLTADELDLDAADGIGAGAEIETVATSISADTTNGDIDLDNANASATTASSLTTGTGNIDFGQTGGGALTLTTATTTTGNIDIDATSGIQIDGGITAGGAYDITASGGDVIFAANGKVTGSATSSIEATAGSIANTGSDESTTIETTGAGSNLTLTAANAATQSTKPMTIVSGGDLTLNAPLDNTSSTTALSSADNLAINKNITDAASISAHSGTDGTGDVTFGAGVTLDAPTISLRSGDGPGGGANAVVDILTNTPTIVADTLAIQQDGQMGDSVTPWNPNVTNNASIDLISQSDESSIYSTDADSWQSIMATANSGITLTGDSEITTGALNSATGNISVRATSGNLHVTGGINQDLAGDPTGGVSLIADDGKIYTSGDTLNVDITGYSDGTNGVGLPKDSSKKAAIVIWSKLHDLNLGSSATLTALGTYDPKTADNPGGVDDRSAVGFQAAGENAGAPIDVAIYLGSFNQQEPGAAGGDITVDSHIEMADHGTMVIDAYDTVHPFGSNFKNSNPWNDMTNRLEVVSRKTVTLPSEGRLPHDLEVSLGMPIPWFRGEEYVLRGKEVVLAEVLGIGEPAPLAVPRLLEPEDQGEVEPVDEGELMAWLAAEGLGPYLAQAYPPTLNASVDLKNAAEKLRNYSRILTESTDAEIAGLAVLVNQIGKAPVPIEEQMASFVQALERNRVDKANYAAIGGEWIDALVGYVEVLNTGIGYPVGMSVEFVMGKYGGRLTDPDAADFVEGYLMKELLAG